MTDARASLFDVGPSGKTQVAEIREFAARMHPDIGPYLGRDVVALATAAEAMYVALVRISQQQPSVLAKFREHNIVFDGPLGADPKNWQHVAFTVYTDLCEVDMWARHALEEAAEANE